MIYFFLWFSIFVVIFTYFGFLGLLIIVSLFKRSKVKKGYYLPVVSIIIAAHNEEGVIKRRIKNLLDLDYPREKIDIIIASDGSTDRTNQIVESYSNRGVTLVASETQIGKSGVQNMAGFQAQGEIILFSDADTLFKADFLKKIVPNFSDLKVGCVTGNVTWSNVEDSTVSKFSGGAYWKYEFFLRHLESKLGVLHSASGPCTAIRKNIFNPIIEFAGEDIVMPLDCILSGYKVVYEPEAVAYETIISSVKGEFESRDRMATRTIRGILSKKQLLNPLKYPLIASTIIFHPLLRYFVPFFLIIIFISNVFLLDFYFYRILFVLQLIFYFAAIIGYFLETSAIRIKAFSYPFIFCLAHAAFMLGTIRAVFGKDIVSYQSVE